MALASLVSLWTFSIFFSLSWAFWLLSHVLLSDFALKLECFLPHNRVTPPLVKGKAEYDLEDRQNKILNEFAQLQAQGRLSYWFNCLFEEPSRFLLGQFSANGTWRQQKPGAQGRINQSWSPQTDLDELYRDAKKIGEDETTRTRIVDRMVLDCQRDASLMLDLITCTVEANDQTEFCEILETLSASLPADPPQMIALIMRNQSMRQVTRTRRNQSST